MLEITFGITHGTKLWNGLIICQEVFIMKRVDKVMIYSSNLASVLPQLNLDDEVIYDIQTAVAYGKQVTVSQSNINFNGWTGAGYIIFDPVTGGGAYLISGGLNGAFLAFNLFLVALLENAHEFSLAETNFAELFAKVEMVLEPYVVAAGMITIGTIVAAAGFITIASSLEMALLAGTVLVSIAGLLTLIGGISILMIGIDIISDKFRNNFNLPDWFDVIPPFNFFPPHENH